MTESLAIRCRPKQFGEVWGQEFAVRALSGLIKRGKIRRNLLLHGSVGSGKTSLIRLYGKALNCEQPLEVCGSPCLVCRPCKAEQDAYSGFCEYDVPGSGGHKLAVKKWVDANAKVPFGSHSRILFFDEAHDLEDDAADFLLKKVEEPPSGVIYCFATTEPKKVKEALRSRLLDFEVRPLQSRSAIGYLQHIAEKEDIDYDRDALALLAGFRPGYPRDLVNGLELVHEPGTRVSVDRVREALDVDYTDRLVEYFFALADGDAIQQTEILFAWQESAQDKASWIQALLASLYYNDILLRTVIVNGLTDSIRHKRPAIIQRFCSRLGLSKPGDLAPYWRNLMDFWRAGVSDLNDDAATLRLALFQHRVNHSGNVEEIEKAGFSSNPYRPTAAETFNKVPHRHRFHSALRDKEQEGEFFDRKHARTLINHASNLIQLHGKSINARFNVQGRAFDAINEVQTRSLIEAFCDDLRTALTSESDLDKVAFLICFERNDAGPAATVLAHIPQASTLFATLGKWCEDWRAKTRTMRASEAIRFKTAKAQVKQLDLDFHWNEVMSLCSALDDERPEKEERGPALRDLLKIPKRDRRELGSVRAPRLVVAGLLDDQWRAKRTRLRLPALSAFDDGAWSYIRSGWELKEFHDRQRSLKERCEAISISGATTPSTIGKRIKLWSSDAKERSRSWQVWWLEQEV